MPIERPGVLTKVEVEQPITIRAIERKRLDADRPWAAVRVRLNGMLVLEAEEAKNEQPRKFPLDIIPELRETIEQQLEATRKLEVETGRVIPLLFHNEGRRIVDYLPAWRKACAAAGLAGKLVHDFRRTSARNLVNAGVDPLTAMRLMGWEDISMLKRYAIIDDAVLKRGVEKLAEHLITEKQRAKKVTAIRG